MNNGDQNYTRYVGWREDSGTNIFFSKKTVRLISEQVTKLTLGVDPKNRPIVVPDCRILQVMDSVYSHFAPTTGDIFTRYSIPNPEQNSFLQNMIDQTIELITDFIRNDYAMGEANSKLSAWVQVYGDFNTNGLRAHSEIKVRDKRPSTMQFNMNY